MIEANLRPWLDLHGYRVEFVVFKAFDAYLSNNSIGINICMGIGGAILCSKS